MTTHALVELLEPVRRGRTVYSAGHHFERLSLTPSTAMCRDSGGRIVRIQKAKLRVIKDAPAPPPKPATLAEIVRKGLVKPAHEILEVAS